jgi:rhodanese-related sulfurtransferase
MASQIKPAAASSEVPTISRGELLSRIHDHTLHIVDVLPTTSYAEAHIPGAINLPLEDLKDRAHDLLPNFNAEIAVYCAKFT